MLRSPARTISTRMNFMGEPAPRRATYRDLEKVPDHMVAEILNGELVASPRPAAPHAVAASAIGTSSLAGSTEVAVALVAG